MKGLSTTPSLALDGLHGGAVFQVFIDKHHEMPSVLRVYTTLWKHFVEILDKHKFKLSVAEYGFSKGEQYMDHGFYSNEREDIFIYFHGSALVGEVTTQDKKYPSPNRVNSFMVIFSQDKFAEVDALVKELRPFVAKRHTSLQEPNQISLLCHNANGFFLSSVDVSRTMEIDLEMNYGKKFPAIHKKILDGLNQPQTGLVLLHGFPGTGKTSYIRYLLGHLTDRVIYVPTEIMFQVSRPEFMPFMVSNPGTVLVIEDAEELVVSREDNSRNTGITNLLNLTDGILGDCIGVKVICTFNTSAKNVDKALLRKGRLVAQYEFSKLSIEESNILLTKIGSKHKATEPMSLAEIYNCEVEQIKIDRPMRQVGFNVI